MAEQIRLELGRRYGPDLWDLHKHLARLDRRAETPVTIHLTAPIQSEAIDVAVLSGSLYLIGIRGKDGRWNEFANDAGLANSSRLGQAKPRLTGSRFITAGNGPALSSYRALGVTDRIHGAGKGGRTLRYIGGPIDLLAHFAYWRGTLNTDEEKLRVAVLILVVCEALRFRSIENVCFNWVTGRNTDGSAGNLAITPAMLHTIQNWRSKARDPKGDHDVTMSLPELRDPLID